MTLKYQHGFLAFGILLLCAACTPESNPAKEKPPAANLPVIRITDDIKPLPFGNVELTLEIVNRDPRGLPSMIGVTFRNKSSARGCLALPRPVVEGQDYDPSLPCLSVGMRSTGGSTPSEPFFLYTIPRGQKLGPLEGVYLEPGAAITRQYPLSSFCIIGHGISPKPAANFLACYEAGSEASELRAYIMTDWKSRPTDATNPIVVQTSKFDFSVRLKLGD